jgi:hypothetical protein
MDALEDREIVLNRFRTLMRDIFKPRMRRNCFTPWEVELLLDFESCQIPQRKLLKVMKAYQKAAERSVQRGTGAPLKLSEFLGQVPRQ